MEWNKDLIHERNIDKLPISADALKSVLLSGLKEPRAITQVVL